MQTMSRYGPFKMGQHERGREKKQMQRLRKEGVGENVRSLRQDGRGLETANPLSESK